MKQKKKMSQLQSNTSPLVTLDLPTAEATRLF